MSYDVCVSQDPALWSVSAPECLGQHPEEEELTARSLWGLECPQRARLGCQRDASPCPSLQGRDRCGPRDSDSAMIACLAHPKAHLAGVSVPSRILILIPAGGACGGGVSALQEASWKLSVICLWYSP